MDFVAGGAGASGGNAAGGAATINSVHKQTKPESPNLRKSMPKRRLKLRPLRLRTVNSEFNSPILHLILNALHLQRLDRRISMVMAAMTFQIQALVTLAWQRPLPRIDAASSSQQRMQMISLKSSRARELVLNLPSVSRHQQRSWMSQRQLKLRIKQRLIPSSRI